MNVHPVLAVLRKELLDAARDRRTVASALLFPVLGPLVVGVALSGLARGRVDRPLVVPVANASAAPSLVAFLARSRAVVAPAPPDPRGAVRRGEIDVALVVDGAYAGDFAGSRPARVELVHDGTRSRSASSARRLGALLQAYSRETGETRLLARGVSPRITRALRVEEVDLSTAAARAGFALATVPVFLLAAAFASGMGVAADATAGERERGSLEPLLLSPAPPFALALGKWLAAATAAVAGTALTLLVIALMLRWEGVQALDVPLGLGAADAARLAALLVPLALLAAALQLLIGLTAQSYKEAQTQLSLLLLAPMLPGFLFAFGAVTAAPWMERVPVLAQSLLAAEALRGEALSVASLALLGAITVATALGAVAATAFLLRRERIVLGR